LVIAQKITFDTSGLDATIQYLGDMSSVNFEILVNSPGNVFAHNHYRWSNMDTRTTTEEFWRTEMGKISNVKAVIKNALAVRDYLLSQNQSIWLPEVLDYLPRDHKFSTRVYMNLGYDNIAHSGDVALNLNHSPFHMDHREAVYYLMHELAHAGYLKYHRMMNLAAPKTWRELIDNVIFLTHLEGMGVLTPLRLRIKEGRLTDPDYVALRDPAETGKRVHAYFKILEGLEDEPDRIVEKNDLDVYDHLSGKPLRLWYIAGCHMAQVIESKLGVEALRELVREGNGAFFKTYRKVSS
jgi:hypothetical protein